MKKREALYVVAIILLLIGRVMPTRAEDRVPPVQIEYNDGVLLHTSDCYPYSDSSATDWTVYLYFPDGIAAYSCADMTGGLIRPIPQGRESLAKVYNEGGNG